MIVADDHAVHQNSLEIEMSKIKAARAGTKLTVQDYANELGISGPGVENIRELFETGRF
jgi:DNA-binding transcriptional regulator YiaG